MFFLNNDAQFLSANRHYFKYLLRNGGVVEIIANKFVSLKTFSEKEVLTIKAGKKTKDDQRFEIFMDLCVERMSHQECDMVRREFMSNFFFMLFIYTDIQELSS